MRDRDKIPSDSTHTLFPRWRSYSFICYFLTFLFLLSNIQQVKCDHEAHEGNYDGDVHNALVNVTYYDSATKKFKTDEREMGHYGIDSKIDSVSGILVHVRTKENRSDGCTDYVNAIPTTNWIALIERGNCLFHVKIYKAAKYYNASAVIIYNDSEPPKIMKTDSKVKDVVSIFIDVDDGRRLAKLVDSGKNVQIKIKVGSVREKKGNEEPFNPNNISKTSVLFVSISFIVLMIISLAWLVFYYIQRFRYAHAKERLTRRLASAAKKAIAKIPQRPVKAGDRELELEFDPCAVCIEGYKPSEVIRILPCKHIFHKSCVDPWLLEQRSCPMCKMDILRAYGMQLNSSKETVHDEDNSGVIASGLADEAEQLSSQDEHGAESMNIVLIRHPSVHYHGSDTFCLKEEDELEHETEGSERQALNPHQGTKSFSEITTVDIEGDHISDDVDCNESHSLMTGELRKASLRSGDLSDV